LLSDVFAITGVFTTLSYFIDRQGSDEFSELKGALGRSVPEGIALILFVANLVGVPPLPGFIGKFTLISAAARHGWNFLSFIAVIAVLISSIAAARFLGNLLSDFRSRRESMAVNYGHRIYIIALLIPLFLMTAFSELALKWAGASVDFILW
jgi:NADH:ubiquinone oxidoreductase subunit 2 (subunit N)